MNTQVYDTSWLPQEAQDWCDEDKYYITPILSSLDIGISLENLEQAIEYLGLRKKTIKEIDETCEPFEFCNAQEVLYNETGWRLIYPIIKKESAQYGWDDTIKWNYVTGFIIQERETVYLVNLPRNAITNLSNIAYQEADNAMPSKIIDGKVCDCGKVMDEERDYTHGCGDICYWCS